jgi:OmcA/MtrC family decaheme c-type cytochrome
MANCVTCHDGKLGMILTDEKFTPATCKSCHPVTGVGGTDSKRAPALKTVMGAIHGDFDVYGAAANACNGCHSATGFAPTFAEIHSGYDKLIYAADGTPYSDIFKAQIDSATFDSATNKLTVEFSATKTGGDAVTLTAADITPLVVVSLYGYETKDFLVGGHGSHADGKRNLEAAFGTAHPRLAFSGTAPAWKVEIDLSTWAGKITDGSVKRAEIGILPKLLSDPAVSTSPALAIAGVSKTFDLAGNAVVADADAYGRSIVSVAKCDACHDKLGVTFHNASYGSAGVVGCRLCHIVGSGGSHLEMQSRSIDSYVHAIHSMQPFDIGDVDFADPIEAMHYEHHIDSVYPKFTTLNCESCHNAGTYGVPDQFRSLPGLLSKADVVADRNIGAVPAYVVGPASRACGACHRAKMINEDQAGELAAFNAHTASFGTLLDATTNGATVLDEAIAKLMAMF